MIKITSYAHQLLEKHPNPNVAIDMTCGHGFDTLFLATIAKKVYAFDIQPIAIEATSKLIASNHIPHVEVIKASHDQILEFVKEPIDLVIYNLGYLPGGDHKIRTDAPTVLKSLELILNQLKIKGMVVIVVYLHTLEESLQLETYLKLLDSQYDVLKHQVLNKEDCPYILEIQKCK